MSKRPSPSKSPFALLIRYIGKPPLTSVSQPTYPEENPPPVDRKFHAAVRPSPWSNNVAKSARRSPLVSARTAAPGTARRFAVSVQTGPDGLMLPARSTART
jgi:hypothetical protein